MGAGHWLKVEGPWGRRSFYSGDPDMFRTCLNGAHSLSGYVMLAVWHVTGRLTCPADSLARRHSRLHNGRSLTHHWQTHLPDATSLQPSAVRTWYWMELCREACWDNQTRIWIASHLLERLTLDMCRLTTSSWVARSLRGGSSLALAV